MGSNVDLSLESPPPRSAAAGTGRSGALGARLLMSLLLLACGLLLMP